MAAAVEADSSRVQPSRYGKRWKGSESCHQLSSLRTGGDSVPITWLCLSLNAAIKVEEGYQSLKSAKSVEQRGLGKLKYGHHQ